MSLLIPDHPVDSSAQPDAVTLTFTLTTRDLNCGLVGVILTGFRDGVVASRMNAAAVKPERLDRFLAEMRASLTAKGLVGGDALRAVVGSDP